MKLASNGGGIRVFLDQSPRRIVPPQSSVFAATGRCMAARCWAVILTGMGQDGLHGVEILKAQGASVIAQDEASSVVWGMPRNCECGSCRPRTTLMK